MYIFMKKIIFEIFFFLFAFSVQRGYATFDEKQGQKKSPQTTSESNIEGKEEETSQLTTEKKEEKISESNTIEKEKIKKHIKKWIIQNDLIKEDFFEFSREKCLDKTRIAEKIQEKDGVEGRVLTRLKKDERFLEIYGNHSKQKADFLSLVEMYCKMGFKDRAKKGLYNETCASELEERPKL